MNQVSIVSIDHVNTVWPEMAPFIKSSLATSLGDYTIDQVKLLILQGSYQLLAITNNDGLIGATVVYFINYPSKRVCYVFCLGGKNLMNEETISQVADWAKANGATSFRATVQDAQARLYKQKAGFTIARYVVEKAL
jgi:hypothetical protein